MRHQITYHPGRDYYSILGVASNVTKDDLRIAYRRRVRETHPDLHPNNQEWATQQLQLINEAYNVLNRPYDRMTYDQLRRRYVRSYTRSSRPSPPRYPRSPSAYHPRSSSQPRTSTRPRTGPRTYSTDRTRPGPTGHERYQSHYSNPQSHSQSRTRSRPQASRTQSDPSARQYYTPGHRTYAPLTREEKQREQRFKDISFITRFWLLIIFGLIFSVFLRGIITSIAHEQTIRRTQYPAHLSNAEINLTLFPKPTSAHTPVPTRDPASPPVSCLPDSDTPITQFGPLEELSYTRIANDQVHTWTVHADSDEQILIWMTLELLGFGKTRPRLLLCDSDNFLLAEGEQPFFDNHDRLYLGYEIEHQDTYTIMITSFNVTAGASYAFDIRRR